MASARAIVLAACLVLTWSVLGDALLATGAVPTAPQKPLFRPSFQQLADQIPEVVGVPLEPERPAENGDALQQTSGGLMVWNQGLKSASFTDGQYTWTDGPSGIASRLNVERFSWEEAGNADSTGAPSPIAPEVPLEAPPPLSQPRPGFLNGSFLMLNMHGALFHSAPADFQENVAYARWMRAGVIRVFATDSNLLRPLDGREMGRRIVEAAPTLRAANLKLVVALVNNHRPVPGEAADSFGWMDDYHQLLLPFYSSNWRGAYLRFAVDLISTVVEAGAKDVIFAWELGNELHTPRDPELIVQFITKAVQEIRRIDATTPILPGTMGSNHLQPWNARSPVARWLYCEAPIDAYTLHAYDWVSQERQGDMPISWDLDYTTLEPCPNGRRIPVIVEELGTSRALPGVYGADEEQKRLEQELRQLRFVLGYSQVVGIGAWNGVSPKVKDRTYYDNVRGLTSYGPGAEGEGSLYDPRPLPTPGVRGQLEELLRNLPELP